LRKTLDEKSHHLQDSMNDKTREANKKILNIKMMVEFSLIKNFLEGLFSSILLLPSFVTMNTILRLELLKKQVS
jgi:hypothetical protein